MKIKEENEKNTAHVAAANSTGSAIDTRNVFQAPPLYHMFKLNVAGELQWILLPCSWPMVFQCFRP